MVYDLSHLDGHVYDLYLRFKSVSERTKDFGLLDLSKNHPLKTLITDKEKKPSLFRF
jgi:hypothetical protein